MTEQKYVILTARQHWGYSLACFALGFVLAFGLWGL
jgi:hypothetical protein